MTYHNLVARECGGPEVLEVVEREQRMPTKGEARIRVLAACVSRPDVSAWRGDRLIPVPTARIRLTYIF